MAIYDLPIELLSEIASHLEFADVISLHKSTRKLQEATEARVVWHSLAKGYTARQFNVPRPENGTIHTLTTSELRDWVRPRLAIDQIWRKKTVVPYTRILQMHKDTTHLNLIPGGRWLLAARNTGHVDFYDLDLKEPILQALLEPSAGLGKEESAPTQLAFDINHEAPALDFTFAFSATGSIWYQIPSFGWSHISRVQLVGQGPSATLVAHKIISIRHIRIDAPAQAIGLRGDLFARSVITRQNSWIEVFNWKECTPTQLKISSIRVQEDLRSGRLYFIGRNRVLCVAGNIFIYEMPPLSRLVINWGDAGYQRDEDPTRPVWTYSKVPLSSNSNPSFAFDGIDSYRLVVQDRRNIVGISVPLSPDQQPCIHFRIQPGPLLPIGIGLRKGFLAYDDAPSIRFAYGWDDNVNDNFISPQGKGNPSFWQVLFDEETGRTLLRKGSKVVKIIDFLEP